MNSKMNFYALRHTVVIAVLVSGSLMASQQRSVHKSLAVRPLKGGALTLKLLEESDDNFNAPERHSARATTQSVQLTGGARTLAILYPKVRFHPDVKTTSVDDHSRLVWKMLRKAFGIDEA